MTRYAVPVSYDMTLYYIHATQAYTDVDLSGYIVKIDAMFQVRDRDDLQLLISSQPSGTHLVRNAHNRCICELGAAAYCLDETVIILVFQMLFYAFLTQIPQTKWI